MHNEHLDPVEEIGCSVLSHYVLVSNRTEDGVFGALHLLKLFQNPGLESGGNNPVYIFPLSWNMTNIGDMALEALQSLSPKQIAHPTAHAWCFFTVAEEIEWKKTDLEETSRRH